MKSPDLEKKKHLFQYLSLIREFFANKGFIDILSPPMVSHPGMEAHIHPFKVVSTNPKLTAQYFLNTSPEFYLKNLLSQGFENIFSITYSHRDEPLSPQHRPQFMMLEWYENNADLEQIKNTCSELLKYLITKLDALNIPTCIKASTIHEFSVQDLFKKYCDFDIIGFQDKDELRSYMEENFKDLPLPAEETCEWDDYFFLLYLNKIEPHLQSFENLFVTGFPIQLAALSQADPKNSKLCQRFEWYIKGVEVGNCFQELQDLSIQKSRFKEQVQIKKKYYDYELPSPDLLFESLERGLPTCSGIAVGLERLFCLATGYEFPFTDEAYL